MMNERLRIIHFNNPNNRKTPKYSYYYTKKSKIIQCISKRAHLN